MDKETNKREHYREDMPFSGKHDKEIQTGCVKSRRILCQSKRGNGKKPWTTRSLRSTDQGQARKDHPYSWWAGKKKGWPVQEIQRQGKSGTLQRHVDQYTGN